MDLTRERLPSRIEQPTSSPTQKRDLCASWSRVSLCVLVSFCLLFLLGQGCGGGNGGGGEPGDDAGASACTQPGIQQECACDAQKKGLQTCSAKKTWGSCSCNQPAKPCTQVGGTQACLCLDQPTGTQTCRDTKKWGPCVCPKPDQKECKAAQTRACTCADKSQGQQSCGNNGKWQACLCKPPKSCKDGDKQECVCDDKTSLGSQVCQSGQWSKCASCRDPSRICGKVGETRACQCSNGGISNQTCDATKTWSDCNCGGPICKVGQKQDTPCLCPNGMESVRYCVKGPNGPYWGACDCSCKTGQTRACACPFQQPGKRSCVCQKAACSWGVCRCPVCRSDADCKGSTIAKRCDLTLGRCVVCTKKADCQDPKLPFCANNGACVACLKDADCSGGLLCDPLNLSCKKFGRGSVTGMIRRCKDGVPRPEGCAGNSKTGDNKGNVYFLFFSGKSFPPKYIEKPFLVHKMASVDFSSSTTKIPYKIDKVPEGTWLVYAFIDDNGNWNPNNHMPDTGDLVGFASSLTVKANASASFDFFLWDRY